MAIPGFKQLPNGIHVVDGELGKRQLAEVASKHPPAKPYMPKPADPGVLPNSEALVFNFCFENNLPFLVVGPPASGKTTLIEWMAAQHNLPMATLMFTEESTISFQIGTKTIYTDAAGSKHMLFQDGPIAKALRGANDTGAVIYFDEVRNARGDLLAAYNSMTDHRRFLPIDATGEAIPLGNRVIIAASYNPGIAYSTHELNPAFARRFPTLRMGYLGEADAVNLTLQRAGVEKECSAAEVARIFKERMLDGQKLMKENKAETVGREREIAVGLVKGVGLIRDGIVDSNISAKDEPGDDAAAALKLILAGFDYTTAVLSAIINPILSDIDAKWQDAQAAMLTVMLGKLPHIKGLSPPKKGSSP